MRLDFGRTTVVLVIFIVVIIAIVGVSQFVQSQPPIEIDIVVDPIAEEWMMAVAQAYNSQNNLVGGGIVQVSVNIQVVDDLDVWRGNVGWNSQNHPHGWIPTSSLSLDYVPSSLPFEVVNDSVAFTPLIWGGFQNRVDEVTNDGVNVFDWSGVQPVADGIRWNDGGLVNMAINWPTGSMAGIGALSTAVADYHQSTTITSATVNDADFAIWFDPLKESLLNSRRIGGNPAQAMASRGTGVADFALLPEVEWLTAYDALTSNHTVAFSYPVYQFILDFPVAVWNDPQTTANEQEAVTSFATFLETEGQAIAIENGFRPTDTDVDTTATLFADAISSGIVLDFDMTNRITAINRSVIESIIALVE